MTPSDPALLAAIEALWRIPRPGPDKLFSSRPFVALSELCDERFGGGKPTFALSHALRAVGLPCQLPAGRDDLILEVGTAAALIERAFRQRTTVRRYLCPLDLADDLPTISFGTARLGQFTVEQLELLFDAPRLARTFPDLPFQARRFAQFHWLVVEERIPLGETAEARAAPWMVHISRDFGAIDPHLGRFPKAVEAALFYLLLAPWEEWSTMTDLDWRGFRIPWIYTLDDDLFTFPKRPPSPDDLTLEPWFVDDRWGEEIELERPTTYPLKAEAALKLSGYPPSAWSELEQARASSLLETPVVHFLVRAFLADGIDEFMAHMTTIEAALGLELDHRRKLRPKGAPHPTLSSTQRVAARVAAALSDPTAAKTYQELFEVRSGFVHGRAGLNVIPSKQRLLARSLARRAAGALVSLALNALRDREEVLADLLDQGVAQN